jgi:hypothetical protein
VTQPSSRSQRKPRPAPAPDDTAEWSLSKVERRQLGMDSWEPSLLRQLLAAQNRLRKREEP